jgi:hypothetical protein
MPSRFTVERRFDCNCNVHARRVNWQGIVNHLSCYRHYFPPRADVKTAFVGYCASIGGPFEYKTTRQTTNSVRLSSSSSTLFSQLNQRQTPSSRLTFEMTFITRVVAGFLIVAGALSLATASPGHGGQSSCKKNEFW